jgi:subtilisin family serine protease
MSGKTRKLSSAALAGVATFVAGSALAGNLFGSFGSTADGYYTWDSDVINIEDVSETGAGVYVAVLDTGLVPHWRDYFPEARVATHLGTGFFQPVSFKAKKDVCGLGVTVGKLQQSTWVGSRGSTHGTHVASTILGYSYRSNSDAAGGFPLPPIMVRGIAPDVTIIPVRVLADYQVPALPACDGGIPAQNAVFGTDEMIAAGINYVTDLAIAGYRPMVINMSLGGSELDATEKAAIDRAVANGVIVVASAGNEGEEGMGYPGAYGPVISVGSIGWVREWLTPDAPSTDPKYRYRMWWLQYPDAPLLPGTAEVPDPTSVDDLYVSDFSSRELPGQELDVLAPGSWVRGPFAGDPGFSHLPWWSKGIGDLVGRNPGNFYYVGGTSMASPHVAGLAAMMLEKNPALMQSDVEKILKGTALPMPSSGSRDILDNTVPATVTWDTQCGDVACDPVGSGVVLADEAIGATP